MRQKLAMLALIVTLMLSFGCACKGDMIRVSEIKDSVYELTTRHDVLVEETRTMSDLEKEVALMQAALLRKVIANAEANLKFETENPPPDI